MSKKNNNIFDAKQTLTEIEDKFEMFQILNEEGEIIKKEADPKLSDEELVEVNDTYGLHTYFRSTFNLIKPSRTS